MGAPTLKKKKELNYRKGRAWKNCHDCNSFAQKLIDTNGNKHVYGPGEGRCTIIGLFPGRAYRINPKNICDAHDNSDLLKRLRGY